MNGSEDGSRADAELRDALGLIRAVHENSSPRGAEGAVELPDEEPETNDKDSSENLSEEQDDD